jgi:hypothetical protein
MDSSEDTLKLGRARKQRGYNLSVMFRKVKTDCPASREAGAPLTQTEVVEEDDHAR